MQVLKAQPSLLHSLHGQSSRNKGALLEDGRALCFYCLGSFLTTEIKEWIHGEDTALCPRCGIDSVIPRGSLPSEGDEAILLLTDMRTYWFDRTDNPSRIYSMRNGKPHHSVQVTMYEEEGLTMDAIQQDAHRITCEKGFWDESCGQKPTIPEKLALVHAEVSEALEEFRNDSDVTKVYFVDGKPEGFGVELADVIIRVADLAEKHGICLSALIKMKMRFNATRPRRHGNKNA